MGTKPRKRSADRGRLIVVSNRLPITLRQGPSGPEGFRSTGGLVTAFEATLQRLGGLWIGWPGLELGQGDKLPASDHRYQLEPVPISRRELKGHYHGFSNRALWPLFHTMPERANFEAGDWESFEVVNRRFAEVTAATYHRGDLVWINDFQLLLTPEYLRRRRPAAAIGFFLHIPFPPYDVFRVLPRAKEVLRGMLAADLIGFHVNGYVRNFLGCAEQLLDVKVEHRRRIIHHGRRVTQVAALPLGIDFNHFETLARHAPSSGFASDQQVILGVDRLDYTKGIPERLQAFARLLERHPEHRSHVTFVQLAVPSRSTVREYQQLKRNIDELVGRINGQFGTATWTPIRYLYRSVSQERLAGWYRDADVALVTPLRDGMNLVAKEYVACQVDEPGVLVLSDMAGAAETMTESLLVNPYAIDDVAAQLHAALIMLAQERRQRMRALRRRERTTDVHAWAKRFTHHLTRTAAANQS